MYAQLGADDLFKRVSVRFPVAKNRNVTFTWITVYRVNRNPRSTGPRMASPIDLFSLKRRRQQRKRVIVHVLIWCGWFVGGVLLGSAL